MDTILFLYARTPLGAKGINLHQV